MKLFFLSILTMALAHAQTLKVEKIPRGEGEVVILKDALFVTHASSIFITNAGLKKNIDKEIEKHKLAQNYVIYLMNEDGEYDAHWITEDRFPNYAIMTRDGDHKVNVFASQITVVGGYFTLCFDRTVDRIIKSAQANGVSELTVNFPLNAIYEGRGLFASVAKDSVEDLKSLYRSPNDQTLGEFRNNISKALFLRAIKFYFEYRKKDSFEVYLDGEMIIDNRISGKPLTRFYLK